MKIVVDTREQRELKFKHPHITEVLKQKLNVGDYGCVFEDGYTPKLFFERKSIADLYGTMTNGYARFKREITRANKAEASLIIIVEGTLTEVGKGFKHSRFTGDSMVRKLFTLWTRYNLLTVFCSSRIEMARYITHSYLSIGREYVRDRKGRDHKKEGNK